MHAQKVLRPVLPPRHRAYGPGTLESFPLQHFKPSRIYLSWLCTISFASSNRDCVLVFLGAHSHAALLRMPVSIFEKNTLICRRQSSLRLHFRIHYSNSGPRIRSPVRAQQGIHSRLWPLHERAQPNPNRASNVATERTRHPTVIVAPTLSRMRMRWM